MTKVLATYNIKGGVGKTSAAVNLGYLAARDGFQTLLWDLDPQGASTYLFRIKPKVRGGTRKLVGLKREVASVIKGTDHEGLDLLPADFSYRHMDLALDRFKRPTRRLGRVLDPIREEYDFVFLDCPPSISLVSESVFEAADALLVPIIPATLSSRTFDQLEELAEDRKDLEVFAFFSMVDTSRRLHRQVMANVRDMHRVAMLGAAIPSSEEIEWMGVERTVVAEIAPGSLPALAYEALWLDIKRRLGRPEPARATTLRARS
ncbi:MAG TPA: ParA family protein [Solirubrobacteraceae bacterium]